MNFSPLRKLFALRPSLLLMGIGVAIILILPNVLFTVNTEYGSSFYSYWLTGRVLFAQGQNPYADELFEQAVQRYPDDRHVSGFALPLYAIIPVIPFAFISNFKVALTIWRLLLEAALIYAGFQLVRGFRIQNSMTPGIVCAAMLLLNYYAAAAITDGDISILAITFFMIGMAALRDGESELAGIMFAFSTIKPSVTILGLIWVSLWCLFNNRGTIVAWAGMVWILLFMVAMLFQTNWFMLWLRSMVYYLKYLNPTNFSRLLEIRQPELGGRIGWAISGVMILLMLIEWIVNIRKDSNALEWVLALTLSIGFLVGIPNLGKHLYILWIPAIYAMDKMQLRWDIRGRIYSIVLTCGMFLIPWVLQLFVYPDWKDPVNIVNIVIPFVLMFLLYWNRWWIIDTFIEKY